MKKFHIGATKKLLSAVVALVASIGIATGATFAWFTSNTTVTVQTFTVDVTSGEENLLMAVDKTNSGSAPADSEFKAFVSTSDISTAITTVAGGAIKLDAITTADSGATLTNKAGTTVAATDKKYAQFDLYLKAANATSDNPVVIVLSSGTVGQNAGQSTASIPNVLGNIAANSYGNHTAYTTTLTSTAANATRIGFTIVNAANTSDNKSTVWAPHEGAYNGGQIAAEGSALNTAKAGHYLNNLAADYYNAVLGTSETITQVSNTNFIALSAEAVAEKAGAGKDTLLTLKSSAAVKVTVKIWIEGTDGDCFNAVYNDKLDISFAFSVKAA